MYNEHAYYIHYVYYVKMYTIYKVRVYTIRFKSESNVGDKQRASEERAVRIA